MKTYKFYEDSGHGWLKVTFNELLALGIADQISHYSYIKPSKDGQTLNCYLEEDCDYSVFERAMQCRGMQWKVKSYRSERSAIRNYDSYSRVIKTISTQGA